MARGELRIYIGAAPGVGKTIAMLGEGRRRHERGTDVVVGFVETHGRPLTQQAIGDLEVIPRKQISYRGAVFEEMDTDAVLARAPQVALVDELAHTDVPGSRNEKRWQDIEELLAAGITVISTVNVQHLESLNDVVERITGVAQRETVPDAVVRGADQIELVDMSPEALRRRMAHGNIYAAEKVDAALAHYFRVGNLAALRELALLWLADRVDEGLSEYRERHSISETWETRERVVVALTGASGGELLIRRGARMAARTHADLVGVHVRTSDGLDAGHQDLLDRHRALLEQLGGRYAEVTGTDIADALVGFAKAENATQLLLGASKRSRWAELMQGSVINRAIRRSGRIDVHVISTDAPARARRGASRSPPRAERAEVGAREDDRLGARSRRRAAVRAPPLAVQRRDRRAGDAAAPPAAAGGDRDVGRVGARARGLRGRVPVRRLVLHRADPQLALRTSGGRTRPRGLRRRIGSRQRPRRPAGEALRAACPESGRERGVGRARVRHRVARRRLAAPPRHRAPRRARTRIGRGAGAHVRGLARRGVVGRTRPGHARRAPRTQQSSRAAASWW